MKSHSLAILRIYHCCHIQTVQQMGFPTNMHWVTAVMEASVRGSVQARAPTQVKAGGVALLPIILLISATCGGQVGSMHITHVSTCSTGSPALAWRWRAGSASVCQLQQMPCASNLEGPLLSLPPFEIHNFCVPLFPTLGLHVFGHFGRFHLSASVGLRRPGFGLESLKD